MADTAKPVMSVKDSADKFFALSPKFAGLGKVVYKDLNNNPSSPTFIRYSKDNITKYLSNPYSYEKQLREAVTYIYGASPHFRRLIQYFAGLSDFSYVVSPYKIDPKHTSVNSISRNYRRVLNTLSAMNVKTQFPKILTVCLREDVFYGTIWVSGDTITIQQLPSEFCKITSIEGNVFNVTFDFQYFNSRSEQLPLYPPEFQTKYNAFQKNRKLRYQELDSPTSFAIKCNSDTPSYNLPPFAGILREIYDLEDYRQLKLTKTALENYAMIVAKLEQDSDGNWKMDLQKAQEFWRNLDSVLPEEVGSVLSPLPLDKIAFEKSNVGDTNTISDAEQNLFTAAGVSSLLFNNAKASSNALLLSIKADQAITFGVVKSIEDMVNRFIQSQSYGKNFRVTFLDCSPYNRKELSDSYLKACQYGIPMISYYAASVGLNQSELDSMSYLETEVLGLQDMFRPLQSSATLSTGSDGGAPKKDVGEVSDSREQNIENE